MKKIGVLTLVFQNYGTRLQSFALAKVLNRISLGKYKIEVINLEPTWIDCHLNYVQTIKKIFRSYGLNGFVYLFNYLRWRYELKKINAVNHSEEEQKRSQLFDYLISLIPYTTQKYTCNDVRNGVLEEYDAIVVGSDQVWNGVKVRNQDVFGLKSYTNKKLSYAASFGITSFSNEMFDEYKKIVNSFDCLLMREREGVDICNSMGRDDAEFVLDPTLLLDEVEYESLIQRGEMNIRGEFIFVYSLNSSYKIFNQAYKLAKKNGCKMVVLKRSFCPPDIKKYKGAEELYAVSPEGFLWLIKHAKCVVTNSYHALLFSINFKKSFYLYLDNCDEENSRMLTIVRMLNLENNVFWETQSLSTKIENVDYMDSTRILNQYRNRSIDLLKKSLLLVK
ncbi:polysaccharide pyruvyl transferase family protein [Fibrobacter sp. UWB1]|uniref:polysaccharide pyruvyl transferase family protein n=1 Tax=Fibrobacter sp. UWB1 TaxID=1964355 RepID=UPI0014831FEA|nr:polysaccharide pyruvyl transferase family protein [Fibrobacter sp. UWB1]